MFDTGKDILSFENTYGFSKEELERRRQVMRDVCGQGETLPYFGIDEFKYAGNIYSSDDFGVLETEMVPTRLVVVGSSIRNWGDVGEFRDPSGFDRLWKTFQSMKEEGFKKGDPLWLYEMGGVYMINGGQRRTMSAKALEIEQVPAKVIHQYPTEMRLPSGKYWDRFMKMKAEGRWQGTEQFELDGDGNYRNGSAQVQRHEGVWIFAQNPEKVKGVYKAVGASGQTKLWI